MIFQGKTLQPFELNILLKQFETFSFRHDYCIIQEGQIPQVAIVLIRGEINLMNKKKLLQQLSPGVLLGIHHVLQSIPLIQGCLIKADSDCLIIPKSDLLLIESSHTSDLRRIILLNQNSVESSDSQLLHRHS